MEHGRCFAVVTYYHCIVEDLALILMIREMIEKRTAVLGLERWMSGAHAVNQPAPCLVKLADHHLDLCSPRARNIAAQQFAHGRERKTPLIIFGEDADARQGGEQPV